MPESRQTSRAAAPAPTAVHRQATWGWPASRNRPLVVQGVPAAPARAAVGFPDSVEAPEQRGPPVAWPP